MRVELTYFKTNGKYYSSGDYKTKKQHLWEIWEEVREMQKEKKLPGLVDGHSEFHITIDVPEHPHNHPHLVLA